MCDNLFKQGLDLHPTANLVSQGIMQNAQRSRLQDALTKFLTTQNSGDTIPGSVPLPGNPNGDAGNLSRLPNLMSQSPSPDYLPALMNLFATPGGEGAGQVAMAMRPQATKLTPGETTGTLNPMTGAFSPSYTAPQRATPKFGAKVELDNGNAGIWSMGVNGPQLIDSGVRYAQNMAISSPQQDAQGNMVTVQTPKKGGQSTVSNTNVKGMPKGTAGVGLDVPLTPQDQNVVQAIRENRFPLPTGTALRTPYWQKIIGEVTKQDPSFDAAVYNSRLQLRKDFTSGKAAGNIRSLNTVAQHLDKLDELSTSLNNGNVQGVNSVVNFLKKQTGNPSVTNFESAANAVANEAVTVFKNTGATDEEIQHLRGIVNSSSSPQQLKQYITTVMSLVNGRINALKSQYEEGMGKPVDFKMLDPTTVTAFKKRGIVPADIQGKKVIKLKDGTEVTEE